MLCGLALEVEPARFAFLQIALMTLDLKPDQPGDLNLPARTPAMYISATVRQRLDMRYSKAQPEPASSALPTN